MKEAQQLSPCSKILSISLFGSVTKQTSRRHKAQWTGSIDFTNIKLIFQSDIKYLRER